MIFEAHEQESVYRIARAKTAKEHFSSEAFVVKELGSRRKEEVVELNSDYSDSNNKNQNDSAFSPDLVESKSHECIADRGLSFYSNSLQIFEKEH